MLNAFKGFWAWSVVSCVCVGFSAQRLNSSSLPRIELWNVNSTRPLCSSEPTSSCRSLLPTVSILNIPITGGTGLHSVSAPALVGRGYRGHHWPVWRHERDDISQVIWLPIADHCQELDHLLICFSPSHPVVSSYVFPDSLISGNCYFLIVWEVRFSAVCWCVECSCWFYVSQFCPAWVQVSVLLVCLCVFNALKCISLFSYISFLNKHQLFGADKTGSVLTNW
jgi:hypothetical protein